MLTVLVSACLSAAEVAPVGLASAGSLSSTAGPSSSSEREELNFTGKSGRNYTSNSPSHYKERQNEVFSWIMRQTSSLDIEKSAVSKKPDTASRRPLSVNRRLLSR